MAGAGAFGGQSVMQMMRNELTNANSLVAMLASCNPHAGFQVPRVGHGGLEDIATACGQKRAFYPAFDASGMEGMDDDEGGYGEGELAHPVEKKRRLSFDQVRSLERSFEAENKLEPERKMQLARDLNLQPRQVAVWFQNRRARWKIKQLERDFELLNSRYAKLQADLASILREKDSLKAEVQRLSGTTPSRHSPEPTDPLRKASPAPALVVYEKDGEVPKEQVTTSSGSNEASSELVDSDSPRTVDSGHLFAPEAEGADDALPVKLELGCEFLAPVPPEHGALPWWDHWA